MNNHGNFFAVDRRVWSELCSLNRLNLSISYLILARGTLGDLRTTSWSVKSIEDRTAISRPSAKAAIQTLIDEGFLERKKSGTKPQYRIRSYEEVRESRSIGNDLLPNEQSCLSHIAKFPDGVIPPRSGGLKAGWPEAAPFKTAMKLHRRGHLRRLLTGAFVQNEEVPSNSDWIWLPNSIVDGAADELPPIERIRQTDIPSVLRLYIDIYHEQSLSIDGGVNWRLFGLNFHRQLLGQYGAFAIFAFWPEQMRTSDDAAFVASFMKGQDFKNDGGQVQDIGWKEFWSSFELLDIMGLVDIIPHAITGKSVEGTVIHPMPQDGDGEEAERELSFAAMSLGKTLLNVIGVDSNYSDEVIIFPSQRHMPNVSFVGMIRLKHRAKTKATATWVQRMDEWREMAERYRAHERAALGEGEPPSRHATSMGHQRYIKG